MIAFHTARFMCGIWRSVSYCTDGEADQRRGVSPKKGYRPKSV